MAYIFSEKLACVNRHLHHGRIKAFANASVAAVDSRANAHPWQCTSQAINRRIMLHEELLRKLRAHWAGSLKDIEQREDYSLSILIIGKQLTVDVNSAPSVRSHHVAGN